MRKRNNNVLNTVFNSLHFTGNNIFGVRYPARQDCHMISYGRNAEQSYGMGYNGFTPDPWVLAFIQQARHKTLQDAS